MALTLPLPPDDFSQESGSPPFSLRFMLALSKKANDLVRRNNGTLNRTLADFCEYKVPASEVPHHGTFTRDVVIDPESGVWVRLFVPCCQGNGTGRGGDQEDEARKRPVIFYFHGGGFAVLTANLMAYDVFCRRLCRKTQAVVISVNYRRSPEHRFPTAYDDCYAALRWLKEGQLGNMMSAPGLDLSRCFLMGDSAGANIVHHVGYRAAKEKRFVKVIGQVLLFPFFGGEERTAAELRLKAAPLVCMDNTDWSWKAFLPKGATRDHPACNVFGPHAPDDLSKLSLPPSLVTIAEFDPLKDWQLRYFQGLHKCRQPAQLLYYKGGVHDFHLFRSYGLASQLLSDLNDFILSLA